MKTRVFGLFLVYGISSAGHLLSPTVSEANRGGHTDYYLIKKNIKIKIK